MDISPFLYLLSRMIYELFALFDWIFFHIYGYTVTLGGMIFAILVVLFVIGIFWRGAKA